SPHYHRKFPIILFWSQKSGCTSLANWFFYQIDLLQTALSY
ncbi:glyoxalase, partial [Bacillus thuringiensis]|nr:glyoxalase [Bacillus thuringiensis]